MTLILSHAQALRRYQPVYAGAHRVQGLPLPADRVVTANQGGLSGRLDEFLFRQLGMAQRFARDLRRFDPTVVHAHFGESGPAALTLAEALGVPLVLTYHGRDATITDEQTRRSWRGREYLRGRARVVERAGLIIAVSDFIRGRLVAKGYPGHKVVTFRNGIDVRQFKRRTQRANRSRFSSAASSKRRVVNTSSAPSRCCVSRVARFVVSSSVMDLCARCLRAWPERSELTLSSPVF